jgi:hypothetical protein
MRRFLQHGLAMLVISGTLAAATGALAQDVRAPSAQARQLVAPIALYPDPLVAQILTASTHPIEVAEAWRWVRDHPGLHGTGLTAAVDPQPWDPSVKALTQFPAVLENMDANLGWTTTLGDTYAATPQDLLDAVQALRQQAQAVGQLPGTGEQTVAAQQGKIVIEPVDPGHIDVPAYDPWLVYGAPIEAYPSWVGVRGIFHDGPGLYYGAGIGLLAGAAWGSHGWGLARHDRGSDAFHRHDFGHADDRAGHSAAFHDGSHERAPDFRPQAVAHFNGGGFHGGGFHGGGFHGGGGHGGGGHGGGGHGGGGHGGGGHG